jgi:spore coat polysaccharide biosynthesis protein SpsF|tara:strand:- start:183 stop:929 length:747 start_codon:yes stop_codon:yes gene_type:complete
MSKKQLALIIQARMRSTRFPNKVISDLSGAPLIERILQRVKKVKKIGKIIIATTKRKDDDILVEIAESNKVEVFRGSENDLVDRYYQAIKGKNITHILRLPADNPLPDPSEYNRLINYHLKTDNDFSSNICNFMKNGYPDGFGVEIFTVDSLKKIWRNEKRKKFREHIALNYYDYKKDKKNLKFNFKIGTVKCPKKISRPKLVFDVNYYKDYLFIRQIYEYFLPKKKNFTAIDIIEWYEGKYSRKELK